MEEVYKVTLEAFFNPAMLFVWPRVLFLDLSFALHHKLLKYNNVVTFYLTCLQMMCVSTKHVALLVVKVHNYVLFVRGNVHLRHFAVHHAVLV